MDELTLEDLANVDKWITAAGMFIEAKMRTPFSESEHTTFKKLTWMKSNLRSSNQKVIK